MASINSKVNALRGIKAKVSENKILVLGEFLSLEDFRAYCKLTLMKKGSMVPNFTFKKSIELAILSSINSDIRAFGEKNVKVFLNNEVFILTGLFSSESSKKTIISYLDSLLPNYVDSTKLISNLSNLPSSLTNLPNLISNLPNRPRPGRGDEQI